jgi:DNA topoisomerase-6 subunit A
MSSERDARDQLIDLAEEFYDQFDDGSVPRMRLPTRSKSNIVFDEDEEVWVYGDRTSTRSAKTIGGAQKLLKSIYTIDFLASQLEEERSSTLRELYYLSESWDLDEAQFNDQD